MKSVLFLVLIGCASSLPPPDGALPAAGLARLYRVEDGIYRSAQPSPTQFSELRRLYGIKSVIKLNSPLEARDLTPIDVTVYRHDWYPAGPVDHEDVTSALYDLEHASRPVLIHCEHGVDRTGLLVALWRWRRGSWAAAAWYEWRAFGRDERLTWLSDAFTRETGWSP